MWDILMVEQLVADRRRELAAGATAASTRWGTRPAPPGSCGHRAKTRCRRIREGARLASPLALPTSAAGIIFGVLADSLDLGTLATLVMSATSFSGAAQFAVLSVLAAGGGSLAAVVTALLVNGRYLAFGLSVSQHLACGSWKRFLQSQLVVDESWALSQVKGKHDADLLVGVGLVIYVAWVIGTAIGLVGGDVLGDPRRLGLDAAFIVALLPGLLPQLRNRKKIAAAAIGAAGSLLLTPFAPAGVPLLAAAVLAVAVLGRA